MRTVLVKMQIRVVGHEHYLHKKNFLTLIPLRLGLLEQDLTYCFGMSKSTVSRIIAWINFLFLKF